MCFLKEVLLRNGCPFSWVAGLFETWSYLCIVPKLPSFPSATNHSDSIIQETNPVSCKWLIPWELESTSAKEQMVPRVPEGLSVSTYPSGMCLHCKRMSFSAIRFRGAVGSTLAHLRPEAFSGCKDRLDREANFYIRSRLQTAYLTVTSHL